MNRDRSSPETSGDYEVGYGKPPQHTRFKLGNAGRPKGATKKPKTVSAETLVVQLLATKVKAKRGDRIVEVGIAEVLAQRILAIASRGTPREVAQLLSFIQRYGPAAEPADTRLDIVHHQASGSTVPLPSPDLWGPSK